MAIMMPDFDEIVEDMLAIGEYDAAVAAHAEEKAQHALKRKNTQRAIAHKRSVHTCRKGSGNWNPRPWWDKTDENGVCSKPALGGNKSGNVQHGPQLHRWSKYSPSSKKNTWKKEYSSREIELADLFEKVDARAEEADGRSDAEIEYMWDVYTNDSIRNRRNELIEKKAELTKERDEIAEKYGDIIRRYGELNARINELEDAIYWLD